MVVSLIVWIIVGLLDLVNCINNHKCTWIDYWLVYGALIITLVNQITGKLA